MDEKIKIAVRNAISHLRGYVVILEKEKNIPPLAVRNAIKALEKLLKK